jgi:hypothetical protein
MQNLQLKNSSHKIKTICSNTQNIGKLFKNFIFPLVLIDKDRQPKWNPNTLQDVTTEKVDSYFASLGENELEF